MGRIVAISGGELDTTHELNRYAIKLTKVKQPNVLFIATASHDARGYCAGITDYYNKLGLHSYAFCPHYDETGRDSFDRELGDKKKDGIALENCTAFVEDNGEIYFIRGNEYAKGYQFGIKNGNMLKEEIVFKTYDNK